MAKVKQGASFEVDLNKPLVFQVGHLGDRYDAWIHDAIISKTSPRLFGPDWMEFLTKTYWFIIPMIWLPVACYAEYNAVATGTPMSALPLLMFGGFMIWTAIEYTLHRFVFHFRTSSYWFNTAHYLLHGCHHKHPQDPLRLVMPPALAAIISLAIVPPFFALLPYTTVLAMYGGGLIGYITYDCTHYWLHFGVNNKFPVVYKLRRYHMGHHFKFPENGFGITSPLWDYVFRTVPPPELRGMGKH